MVYVIIYIYNHLYSITIISYHIPGVARDAVGVVHGKVPVRQLPPS